MRILRFARSAAVALIVLSGCSDGGPTSPTEPRLPEPTSELAGEWHGTISYTGDACASEDVVATAADAPSGLRVRLNVVSLCYGGSIAFFLDQPTPAISGSAELIYNGSCLSIFGSSTNGAPLKGQVTGTTNGDALHLETTSFTHALVDCRRPGVTLELVR